jgi:hypothetical protein
MGRVLGAHRLFAQYAREFVAKRIDAMLQTMIKHVADHDHATLRPLPHAAEIGMIELCLRSVALRQRVEQHGNGVEANAMAHRGIFQTARSFRGEVLHGDVTLSEGASDALCPFSNKS